MTDQIRRIPLSEIDDGAMARDRTGLDPEPMAELRSSILASGLRMPVELYPLEFPDETLRWGIISGFRRIATFRELHGLEVPGYDAIPALIRERRDEAARIVSMVEENEIRADLSPWEKGRIAWLAVENRLFPTIEAAVDSLYPAADATKRSRLRGVARLAQYLEGYLTSPEKLSMRQLLRLSNACRNGFTTLVQTALEQSPHKLHERQWELLQPILLESERFTRDDPATEPEPDSASRGRPRRIARPTGRRLVIRREMTSDGYLLRFTGKDATSALLDTVIDEIERAFSPA